MQWHWHRERVCMPWRWHNHGMFWGCLVVNLLLVAWYLYTNTGRVFHNFHVIDQLAMISINAPGPLFADYFFYNISSKTIWLPLVATLAVVLFRGCDSWRQALVLLLVSVAVVALCDQASGVVKRVVERYRPSRDDDICYLLHYVNGYRGGRFGFVSSHAANCFGEAVWLSLLLRRHRANVALFVLATLVCYSRIYLGVHYPLDIVCGACLGIIVGAVAYVATARLMGAGGRERLSAGRGSLAVAWAVLGTVAAVAAVSAAGVFLPR